MNLTPSSALRPEQPREVPLAMDPAAFRAAGHALVDQLAELLASVPSRPVTPGESPTVVRDALALNGPLPEQGTAPGPLLQDTARLLFDHSLFNAHPRFMGYITSSPAPIGGTGVDTLACMFMKEPRLGLAPILDGHRPASRATPTPAWQPSAGASTFDCGAIASAELQD